MKTTFKLTVLLICMIISVMTYAQSEYSRNGITNNRTVLESNESNEVKAEIVITDSETIKGYKNLEFKLSNGMSFTYEDGNYKAGYNNRSLDVKGKYSITSEVGTLSIAFNADDGSIWWVFRKK
ncbi:hypothetical protein [Winogradskyella flava]|uniref:Uncharacterized protein n=1 Tax=Winogradskyella flava TaxID=1884876 RepID=A0A842IYH9_9FLAO|nr:hypothetical protein [Winogradskyella flava]MBC2845828.1 hypothetical protein [Winogradskyella flava]